MDTRINNSSVRPSANNAPANNLPVNNAPTLASTTAMRTTDAVSITSADANGFQVTELQAVIKDLEARIAAMEAQMSYLMSENGQRPSGAAGVTLPPFPGAPANNAPANNAPANNAPANNAPANNAPANNAPANNAPVNNAPANNAPVNNAPANNAPVNNAPVNNAGTTGDPAANDSIGTLRSELNRILETLKGLQDKIAKRIAELDALIRGGDTSPAVKKERSELDKQAAGLQTISHVLKNAKLAGLTPEEEAVVRPALKRVHEIGAAIGEGANPNDFAAELYALKHTLKDPSTTGPRPLVTEGAQIVGLINDHKTKLEARLIELQDHEVENEGICGKMLKEKREIESQLKGLIGVEKALDTAKLTRLTAEGEAIAGEAIARLGDIADEIGGGKADPVKFEDEVFKLGQVLKNPDAHVKTPTTQGEGDSPQVQAGGALITRISDAKTAIHDRLRDIDDKIIAGENAEVYAAERQRLLDRAEALTEVGQVIGGVRLDQNTPAGRRAVKEGLDKAAAIVDGLANGDPASKHRAEVFVLKQTFQEPLLSRDNAAIQSGAAALQMIATAEARNIKQQEEISAKIAQGADRRTFDAESKKLQRQHEDLEAIRHAIEAADFGGLTPEQEAQGAKIIDQMRDIAMKVAGGEDFAKHQKAFDKLNKELSALRYFQGSGEPAATPTPAPTKPAPAPTKPAPAPAPTTPAPTLEPGAMYQVKNGDYLTKIAREKLGDPNRFKDIVELNKDKYPSLVKNPDLIYPGWMLVLPKK